MKVIPSNRERSGGVALIMVMLVIFVLTAIAGGFAYNVKVETTLARNAQDDYEYEWLARSGVELAMWAVGQQFAIKEQPYDSLNQFWSGRKFETNDLFEGFSLTDNQLGRGTFSIEIVDLERKFNVNVANEQILEQAALLIGVDAGDAGVINDSILDWMDRDDRSRINGVEGDYYLGLEPPYRCKDGPIDDLTELMLVNGVSEDMFYGSPPELINPQGLSRMERFRLKREDLPVYTNGFVQFFNSMGIGKVNVNTAPPLVFQLFGFDEIQAQEIITYRAGYDGQEGTEDDTPFQSPAGLARVVGGGGPQMAKFFSVRSATFEVTVTTDIGGRKREKVARIFRRTDKDVRILFSYWK